jgi:hypothetical protein
MWALRVSKKTEKPIKPRKLEKKLTEKTEPWKKNQLNLLEYLKNQPVRFDFGSISLNQTEKKKLIQTKNTEPNWNQTHWKLQKKPKKTI